MAQPSHQLLLASFFLALSFGVAFTSKPNKYPGLKSLHFSLYEQEIFNKTAYLIVRGVNTDVPLVDNAVPFGSLFAFNDPLTVSPDRSSPVVGSIEAMAVVSTLDGLRTVQAMKMNLSLKKHKGSISLVGSVPNIEPGDLVVVGGTGDFLFVQGYVTVTPYNLSSPFLTYTNEFHLYWPPYATY